MISLLVKLTRNCVGIDHYGFNNSNNNDAKTKLLF